MAFRKLAQAVGFTIPTKGLPRKDQNRVLRIMKKGVFGPGAIAKSLGLPLDQVRAFCRQVGVPYGAGGYGMFPMTGRRGGLGYPAPVG